MFLHFSSWYLKTMNEMLWPLSLMAEARRIRGIKWPISGTQQRMILRFFERAIRYSSISLVITAVDIFK